MSKFNAGIFKFTYSFTLHILIRIDLILQIINISFQIIGKKIENFVNSNNLMTKILVLFK